MDIQDQLRKVSITVHFFCLHIGLRKASPPAIHFIIGLCISTEKVAELLAYKLFVSAILL